MSLLKAIQDVTDRIAARSAPTRAATISTASRRRAKPASTARSSPAATSPTASPPARRPTRPSSPGSKAPNLGIVTSYNDMLSAHQPYGTYPDIIKAAAREIGATAQVAGGVPGDVRRRHPGPAGHGPVAVLAAT